MITIKSKEEISKMRRGGRILAHTLQEVSKIVKPGISTQDLEKLAKELVFSLGGSPAFLGYRPGGAGDGYPAALCVSINDEVVHGIPSPNRILKEGDIVKLDLGVEFEGMFTDSAVMVGVGEVSSQAKKIMSVTKECLDLGIHEIKAKKTLADYARVVQSHAEKNGFSVVRDLVGHGVGRAVHEEPQILNYVDARMANIILKEGMTLALEPMVNEGDPGVVLDEDGWTYRTVDKRLNGHWEHTVAVTKEGCEVLTIL